MHDHAQPSDDLAITHATADDGAHIARFVDMAADGMMSALVGKPVERRLGALCRRPGHALSPERARIVRTSTGEVAAGLVTNLGHEKKRRDDALGKMMMTRLWWRVPAIALVYMHERKLFQFMAQAPNDALYIDALAVSPEFRRRGLATRLLDEARSQAREAGATTLELDVVVTNTGAIAAYERFGFVVADTSPPSGTQAHRMVMALE